MSREEAISVSIFQKALHTLRYLTRDLKYWLRNILSTDGTGGAPARPPTPIASAFGDTDGEIFGQKTNSAEKLKTFWSKKNRPKNLSEENFLVEKFLAEKVFGQGR